MDKQELMKGCRLGDMSVIRSSLTDTLVNTQEDGTGWTPLYCAGVFGHSEAVLYLLEKGADPNIPSVHGDTLLHYAVDSGQYKIAGYLLEAGASPNCQSSEGDTPLHHAACRGDARMIRQLCKHHADPSITNSQGRTPLHCAVADNHVNAARALVQNGASAYIEDAQRVKPIDICRSQDMASALSGQFESRKSTPSTHFHNASPDLRDDASYGQPTTSPRSSSLSNHSPVPDLSELKLIEEKIRKLEDMNRKIRETIRESSWMAQEGRGRAGPVTKDDGKLFGWLASLRLESIYPTLVEAGFDDFAQIITQMKSDLPLTEDLLESLGISKQGHRAIFLAALEREIAAPAPFSLRPTKRRPFQCCQLPAPAPSVLSFPSLQGWLDSLCLGILCGQFEDAGYTEVEQMLFLMHTKHALSDKVLREAVGVEKVGHRHRLLCKLKEDAQLFDPRIWPALITSPTGLRNSRAEERRSSCLLM